MIDLTVPLRPRDMVAPLKMYEPFWVVRVGWRWAVYQFCADGLFRWVGPKPLWSQSQAHRVAQALMIAHNRAFEAGRRMSSDVILEMPK